jgi:hypothetical protein
VHDLLVLERRWSSRRYVEWLASALQRELLAGEGLSLKSSDGGMSPSIVSEELPDSVGERQSNDVRAAGEKRPAFGAASTEAASPMRLRFAITQPGPQDLFGDESGSRPAHGRAG